MNNKEFLDQLRVLNDNTRLTIIQMLSKNGTMCACKILEELNITQGTLSHHMKVLTNARLVTYIKDGKWCYYTLVRENVCELAHFIQDICKNDNRKSDCVCYRK